MEYKRFYAEFGKLLYAVANVDGKITKKERTELLDLVKMELVPLEKHTDEYGTDAAYYVEIEFDFLDEQIVDADAAFNSFINYVENHKTAIDKRLITATRTISLKLAEASNETNKKEIKLLKRLNQSLDSIFLNKIILL
jgi:hypothetical protein